MGQNGAHELTAKRHRPIVEIEVGHRVFSKLKDAATVYRRSAEREMSQKPDCLPIGGFGCADGIPGPDLSDNPSSQTWLGQGMFDWFVIAGPENDTYACSCDPCQASPCSYRSGAVRGPGTARARPFNALPCRRRWPASADLFGLGGRGPDILMRFGSPDRPFSARKCSQAVMVS